MLSLCDMYALSSRCCRLFGLPGIENSSLISVSSAVPQPSELSDMVRTELRRERDCHMACRQHSANTVNSASVTGYNGGKSACDYASGLLSTCTELSTPGVIGRYPATLEELGSTFERQTEIQKYKMTEIHERAAVSQFMV